MSRLRVLHFVVATLLLGVSAGQSQTVDDKFAQGARTEVSYCNFEVPKFWKEANASFYLMYSFQVEKSGVITNLKKLRDDIVGEENVKKCLETWKITGVSPNTPFGVVFRWKHGKGWVEQTISRTGFKLTMELEDVGH